MSSTPESISLTLSTSGSSPQPAAVATRDSPVQDDSYTIGGTSSVGAGDGSQAGAIAYEPADEEMGDGGVIAVSGSPAAFTRLR